MKNFMKTISVLIIIGIIGAILVVAGCGKSSKSTSTATTTSTYTVQKGSLVSTVSAVGSVEMPEQTKLTFGTGSSTSSLFTVKDINVAYGDEVKAGDVLATIDTSSLESTITEDKVALSTAQLNLNKAKTEATVLNAKAAVKNAQANLAVAERELEDMQTSQVTDAQTAVKDAQTALDNAKRNLAIIQNNINTNIMDAENSISDAKKTYDDYLWTNIINKKWAASADVLAQADKLLSDVQKAKDNLDNVKLQGETSIANAQSTIIKAETTLKSAEGDLVEIESNNPDMLRQEAAVAIAKANLITAQSDLDYIEAGYNIELLQIKVDNAQTTLDNAMAQLEAATIVAPYDGVVAAVYYDVGAKVSATNEVIYLVNTSKVEISSSVDETDVAVVKAGQTAIVTFDAIENASLEGTVGAISPTASSSSNVVTYSFTIKIENTKGYDLKEGMSASAEIYVLNKTDVLVVPTTAIKKMGPNNMVQVETSEGTTEPRIIQIGDTDGTQTEVTSGLTEGEKIIVQTTTKSSSGSTSSNRTPSGGFNIEFGAGGPPSGGGGSFQVRP